METNLRMIKHILYVAVLLFNKFCLIRSGLSSVNALNRNINSCVLHKFFDYVTGSSTKILHQVWLVVSVTSESHSDKTKNEH